VASRRDTALGNVAQIRIEIALNEFGEAKILLLFGFGVHVLCEMNQDMELLREYVSRQSEPAFETLVARYVNLVYSTAVRQMRDPHLAQEITQAVFIILARKAPTLGPDTIIPSWLHRTTVYAAADCLKSRRRRAQREQEAHMQSLGETSEDSTWVQIAPLLDNAIAALGEKDRQALVLRYFQDKSMQEVGALLGASESAAKMRVNRALEKLRRFFLKRGIASRTAVIAGLISANSVQAAPMALAKTAAAVALVKGVPISGSTLTFVKGTLKLMTLTKIKTATAVVAGLLLTAGTATVAVKAIAGNAEDETWRVAKVNSASLAKAPSMVKVLPTKFPKAGNLAGNRSGDKFIGIGQPVSRMLWVAYDWAPSRMVYPDGEPKERYDFIATVPQGSRQALQQEIKKELGLSGNLERRETPVLLLKASSSNHPGLKPPRPGDNMNCSQEKDGYAIKWDNQPVPRITVFLEDIFKQPVIDQSGLMQGCSLELKWKEVEGKDPEHEALKKVLLEQLGLKLEPARQRLEMLVVEKVK
jgi:uncharacterized protein (TIGR03435 family)